MEAQINMGYKILIESWRGENADDIDNANNVRDFEYTVQRKKFSSRRVESLSND